MERVETKAITIHKAQPIADDHAPNLVITIDTPIERQETLEQADLEYYNEAWELGRALERSLPGGTFDRLLIYLLERKASHFIVPHIKPQAEELSRAEFWDRAETLVRELGFRGWRAEAVVEEIVWQAEEAELCFLIEA